MSSHYYDTIEEAQLADSIVQEMMFILKRGGPRIEAERLMDNPDCTKDAILLELLYRIQKAECADKLINYGR